MIVEFITIKEVSQQWGISTRRISTLCIEGRVLGAVKQNGTWKVPVGSKKPDDARMKNGKYIAWRNKNQMTSEDYQSNLKNLKGTFAVEDMNLSSDTLKNLKKLADGKATYSEIVAAIKQKYMQRV